MYSLLVVGTILGEARKAYMGSSVCDICLSSINSNKFNMHGIVYNRALIFIVLIMVSIIAVQGAREPRTSIKTIVRYVPLSDDVFRPEALEKYLRELNIRHADIVYSQAKLESGNFSSRIFRENNNLFGMKRARQRATTATGENRGHATYSSWRQSVDDYAMYYNKYLSRLSRSEYIEYLGRNYAQDANYISKL